MLHKKFFEEGATGIEVSVLGIDLGRDSCGVVGEDATGDVFPRRLMRRVTIITYAATLPARVVAMEACCGAITWARAGAKPLRAADVAGIRSSYVKAQKSDDCDAETIAEVATRPTMRFVELKT